MHCIRKLKLEENILDLAFEFEGCAISVVLEKSGPCFYRIDTCAPIAQYALPKRYFSLLFLVLPFPFFCFLFSRVILRRQLLVMHSIVQYSADFLPYTYICSISSSIESMRTHYSDAILTHIALFFISHCLSKTIKTL